MKAGDKVYKVAFDFFDKQPKLWENTVKRASEKQVTLANGSAGWGYHRRYPGKVRFALSPEDAWREFIVQQTEVVEQNYGAIRQAERAIAFAKRRL